MDRDPPFPPREEGLFSLLAQTFSAVWKHTATFPNRDSRDSEAPGTNGLRYDLFPEY